MAFDLKDFAKMFGGAGIEAGMEVGIESILWRLIRPDRIPESSKHLVEKATQMVSEGKGKEANSIIAGLQAAFSQEDEQRMATAEIRFLSVSKKKGKTAYKTAEELLQEIDALHDDQKEKVRLWVTKNPDADEHVVKLIALRNMPDTQRQLVYNSSGLTRRSFIAAARTEVKEWLQTRDPQLERKIKDKKIRNDREPTIAEAFGITWNINWRWMIGGLMLAGALAGFLIWALEPATTK